MAKAVIIFGGRSAEREISILTGVFAFNLLSGGKYEPFPVYMHSDGLFYSSPYMNGLEAFKKGDTSAFTRVLFDDGTLCALSKNGKKLKPLFRPDVALNCCHGGLGEGGGVSAIVQMNGIPFASPSLASSAVFMDKTITKLVAKSLGVPVLPYIRIKESDYKKRGQFLIKHAGGFSYPVVVKPARLGSSIGISVAKDRDEIKDAIEKAFKYDDLVIVEKFLSDKKDVNCAVYSYKGELCVSEPEQASSGNGIYGFAEKYLKEKDIRVTYGPVGEKVREKIRAYTRTLYKKTDMHGIVRMDFLVSGEEVYLGEVNTVPGSLAYYLYCDKMTDGKALFERLLDEAKTPSEKEIPSTGILNTYATAGKRRFCVRL